MIFGVSTSRVLALSFVVVLVPIVQVDTLKISASIMISILPILVLHPNIFPLLIALLSPQAPLPFLKQAQGPKLS